MTEWEQYVSHHARFFDPFSLVSGLIHNGYGLDDVVFKSYYSLASQVSLIERVEFNNRDRKVVITLNLGLLAPNTPLPSYFFKQIHKGDIDAQVFFDFFGFFDDRVLRQYILALYPELNATLIGEWETFKRHELQTLKLDTTASLHWLMQQVFPELQVRIRKAQLKRGLELEPLILGKSTLGVRSVFGRRTELPTNGVVISLISDEERFSDDMPWAYEVEARLQQQIFPLLRSTGLFIEIWLVIRIKDGWLKLDKESYLGYEEIKGEQLQFRHIQIFAGRLLE